ncbi:MAG: hypothetical protein J6Q87_05660, partial [Clostridia bacterium]|nr:hypothetical protein [Clostridia bacterium]
FTAVLVEIYIDFQKKEEKKQKEISIQVPVNARNQFDSQTLRNFSLCYSVRFDPNLGKYTFEEILKQTSLYLRYINNKKTLGAMFASNIKLESFPLMRVIPLVIKDLAIGISYALTAETTTTALLTNLGKVDLPEDMLEFVESSILMPPPGLLNGGRIGLSSVKDVFTVAIANCYEDTDVERAFFSKLKDFNIPIEIETNYLEENNDLLLEPVPEKNEVPKKSKKHLAKVTTSLLLALSVISVILNILLNSQTPWSAYIVFACGLLWSLSVLPFVARKFLTKFHSIMAILSTITTFSLLLFIIMSFIPHSIVFDVIVITIAVISFVLFGTSVIAIKNKKFKKWLSKKFYF